MCKKISSVHLYISLLLGIFFVSCEHKDIVISKNGVLNLNKVDLKKMAELIGHKKTPLSPKVSPEIAPKIFELKEETFSESEEVLLTQMNVFFKDSLQLMDINKLEQGPLDFQQKIDKTKLSTLKGWFEELNQDSKLFKLDKIKTKLNFTLMTTEEILKKRTQRRS